MALAEIRTRVAEILLPCTKHKKAKSSAVVYIFPYRLQFLPPHEGYFSASLSIFLLLSRTRQRRIWVQVWLLALGRFQICLLILAFPLHKFLHSGSATVAWLSLNIPCFFTDTNNFGHVFPGGLVFPAELTFRVSDGDIERVLGLEGRPGHGRRHLGAHGHQRGRVHLEGKVKFLEKSENYLHLHIFHQ